MYLTDDLNPVLDLNLTIVNPQMTGIRFVATLPDGGAFIENSVTSNGTNQVLRINVTGHVIQQVHQCVRCSVGGLLVLNNKLYVIYYSGKLVEININNTNTVQVYQVPDVSMMVHYGSLSYHPSVITHPDLLLLTDFNKGEIFSYNVTSKNKEVHLTDLREPRSVSFMIHKSHVFYLVCDTLHHQVHVYNSTWSLYQTLGGPGSGDGQLNEPWSAIGLPDGSILTIDKHNVRVCLFTIQGKFLRHILPRSDGLSGPFGMSVSLPYLYLTDYQGHLIFRLYRYKLY